jgi:hypothetical protein
MTPHALTQVLIALARRYHSTRKLTILTPRMAPIKVFLQIRTVAGPENIFVEGCSSRDGVDQGAKGLKAKYQGLTPFIIPLVLEDLFRDNGKIACLHTCMKQDRMNKESPI